MQNITNNRNNVGKSLEDREYDLRFTDSELRTLYSLVGNMQTHQNYPDTEELNQFIDNFGYIVRTTTSDTDL